MKSRDNHNQIDNLLGIWESIVRHGNLNSRHDGSVLSNKISCKVLNVVYEHKLIVLDDKVSPNYPAVDLGDYDKGIAYSISSEKSKNKVIDDLSTFYNGDKAKRFPKGISKFPNGIRFLFLHSHKKQILPTNLKLKQFKEKGFNPSDHILTFIELGNDIKELPDDKYLTVKNILEDEFILDGNRTNKVDNILKKLNEFDIAINRLSYPSTNLLDSRNQPINGIPLVNLWGMRIFNITYDANFINQFFVHLNPIMNELSEIIDDIEKIDDYAEKERLKEKFLLRYDSIRSTCKKFLNHSYSVQVSKGEYFLKYIKNIEHKLQ